MSSNHSSTYSAQSIQPKFKDCQLAATATKTQLRSWVNLVASVVSNLDDGNPLQSFVDGFTGRNKQKANFRPAFLDDPRLQDDSVTITSAGSLQNAALFVMLAVGLMPRLSGALNKKHAQLSSMHNCLVSIIVSAGYCNFG